MSSENKVKSLNILTVRQPAPRRGPSSADNYNDFISSVVRDLTELSRQWNQGIVPLVSSLPRGVEDSNIDAIANGLDGYNIYVNADSLSTSRYYNTSQSRPNTIKEALDNIYVYIQSVADSVREDTLAAASPLTDAQKERIGSNVFDSSSSSSSTSLDGKSENNRKNLLQVAYDLYDSVYASLDNDAGPNLTYSVRDMVDELLKAHGGSWNSDINLEHSGIYVDQLHVYNSVTENDSFSGPKTTLEDDLNWVKTRIKEIIGTATWTTSLTPIYTGGPDSLEGLFTVVAGDASKSASNPWGYHYTNIEGLSTVLTAIGSFIGQADPTDSSPIFSSTFFVSDSQSLEYNIGVIDTLLEWITDPTVKRSGDFCRRLETGVTGASPYIVAHNQGSYPNVQLVQVDPSVTTSGQYLYTLEHDSLNQFTITLPAGVSLVSGVIVSIW